MKVLLIMPLDHKYGAQHSLKILVSEIQNISPEIEFVVITATYGAVNDFCNNMGIENYVMKHDYATYGLMNNKILQKLKRIYKQIKVGIGYVWAIKKIEKILDVSSFDLIYAGINRDLLGILLAKKYKKPLVIHLHEFVKGHFGHEVLYKNQIQLMNRYATQVIAISHAVSQNWESSGLDPDKIAVVYNGIIPDEIKYRCQAKNDKILRIVMVGGMYEQKGQDQLIRAIVKLKHEYKKMVSADFYGDGNEDYLKQLKQMIDSNALSDICIINGYDPEIMQKLDMYDVGIVCSKAEGFGLVTVEYMMAGLCPVVSDTGANAEIVESGKTGLIYRYGDANDLSLKIQYLIEHPDKRNDMGERSRHKALEKFNANHYAAGVLDILRKSYSL